jgi:pyruvate dehydrogenase E2 component (dihydrolipoamide acetyltransferase)
MAEEVFIPKYGQTVGEVTLIKWMTADGAPVKKGQELLEIETDKTNFTVEAEANGFLHHGPFAEGQVIPVLTVVAIIGKEDEKFAAGAPSEKTAEAVTAAEVEAAAAERTAEAVTTSKAGKVFASPRARKLAAEKGVSLSDVTPTGGEGVRVAERDVVAYLASAPKVTPVAQRLAEEAGVDLERSPAPGRRHHQNRWEKAVRPPGQRTRASSTRRRPPAGPASRSSRSSKRAAKACAIIADGWGPVCTLQLT